MHPPRALTQRLPRAGSPAQVALRKGAEERRDHDQIRKGAKDGGDNAHDHEGLLVDEADFAARDLVQSGVRIGAVGLLDADQDQDRREHDDRNDDHRRDSHEQP